MSAAELQGLQDAGRGPARSGSRLGQNEYGRVMEVGASNRQPLRRGSMSNRDGILDSHPSERVKMPPELAAFDRWDADPNDLAKWEAAMAALAPAAGADNSNATVNL